ncbi:XTP/dITP diphosphatase [Ligilactobacillus ceti]|uniref:dITP/XTP pyrophosphatase n=1 Tax=Ligilactobacillus ceti DSM 22408 TaxID=1122146 RepID=A0A0R2KI06_9LACO|nr:XTP/dITP diphosphatase [Ligilactobacillus ceti]KRN89024.1 nucleoside-triphosphatase [Ligilactobacillus ceti DSM 22408]
MQELVIATNNPGKAREFKEIFGAKGFSVKTLADFPNIPEIIEDGTTFAENALKKAQTLSDILQVPVLADDSGLVVDALNGEPGIYSARYAKDHDDQANNLKLLNNLKDIPQEQRQAHFHCSMVVTAPNKQPLIVEGNVYGYILNEAQGENGFGYDPLFYYPEFKKTFANLTMAEKNSISHRGRAVQALLTYFDQWWQN